MKKFAYVLCCTMLSSSLWASEQIEQVNERAPYKSRTSTLLSEGREGVIEANDYLWNVFLDSIYTNEQVFTAQELDLNKAFQAYLAFKKQVVSDLVNRLKRNGFELEGGERESLKSTLSYFEEKSLRSDACTINMAYDLKNRVSEETKDKMIMSDPYKYSAYLNAEQYNEAVLYAYTKYSFYKNTLGFLRENSLLDESEAEQSKWIMANDIVVYRSKEVVSVVNSYLKDLNDKLNDIQYQCSGVGYMHNGSTQKSMSTIKDANKNFIADISDITERSDAAKVFQDLVDYESYFNSKVEKWGARFKQHVEQSENPMLKSLTNLM